MNKFHKLAAITALSLTAAFTYTCSSGGGGNDDPPPSSSSAGGTSSGGGSSSGGSSSSAGAASLCGSAAYDPSTQKCEGGAVKTECEGEWYAFASLPDNKCEDDYFKAKCGSAWYIVSDSRKKCEDGVVKDKCGTGSNYHNPATQFCDGDSAVDKCGGKVYVPAEQFCDSRAGGKLYNWTKIGDQVWMAENLNHETEEGSACYGNDEDNCDKYGRLYNWATAMDDVCPSGWHLPSDAEWTALITFAGGTSTAGKKLKSESDLWTSHATAGGTDDYGFAALPGGYGSSGSFSDAGNYGYWWSATESSASGAYYRSMLYNYNVVGRDYYDKPRLYSIRCVQN